MPRSMEKTQKAVLAVVARRPACDAETVSAVTDLGLRAARRHLTLLTKAKLVGRTFSYTEPPRGGMAAVGRYLYTVTAKGEAALTASEAA